MTDYRSIFTIRLEHDYYMHNICRAIQLGITTEGILLMKRRNLMFKQIRENEWAIVGDCAGAGVFDEFDILKLEMVLLEPKFVYFTDWKNYQTRYTYHLNMPCKKNIVEASKAMHCTTIKRKGNNLCSIDIQLSNQMFEKAKIGETENNTLAFRTPKVRWEYLLTSRNGESTRNLKIEDGNNQIAFSQIKKVEMELFSHPVFSTTTKSSIPMKEHYELLFSLVEIVRKEPMMKRVLIKQLQYPVLGAFISERSDIIRQIVYY